MLTRSSTAAGTTPEQPGLTAEAPGLVERVVLIKRVAKVVKGGKRMKLFAAVVVGDGKGKVGIGHGKAQEVAQAVRKATTRAQKNMVDVAVSGNTVAHAVFGKYRASRVTVLPAAPGTGLIACPQVRAVLEAAGLKDVLTKAQGSKNVHNLAMATLRGLRSLRTMKQVAQARNKAISHFIEKRDAQIDSKTEEEPYRSEALS